MTGAPAMGLMTGTPVMGLTVDDRGPCHAQCFPISSWRGSYSVRFGCLTNHTQSKVQFVSSMLSKNVQTALESKNCSISIAVFIGKLFPTSVIFLLADIRVEEHTVQIQFKFQKGLLHHNL